MGMLKFASFLFSSFIITTASVLFINQQTKHTYIEASPAKRQVLGVTTINIPGATKRAEMAPASDVVVEVLDTNKKPVEGAVVRLADSGKTSISDKNGQAKFSEVKHGDVSLVVEKDYQKENVHLTVASESNTLTYKVNTPFNNNVPLEIAIASCLTVSLTAGAILLLYKNKR